MEVLGLLDTLESIILDGTKIPLTKKALVDEERVLAVIDKMRLVIQSGGGFAKDAIATRMMPKEAATAKAPNNSQVAAKEQPVDSKQPPSDTKSVEVLQQAYQMAKEIREGADKYADEVLANLEATSTRVLRTVRAGRERLNKPAASAEKK
jgi:cell division septum initiation protein DivIVA